MPRYYMGRETQASNFIGLLSVVSRLQTNVRLSEVEVCNAISFFNAAANYTRSC